MRAVPRVALMLALWCALSPGRAFSQAPPRTPDEATLKQVKEKREELELAIASMRRQGLPDPVITEMEVFAKAAGWIVKHGEWHHADSAKWTLAVLDEGLERVKLVRQGQTPWLREHGRSVRGYRSRIDGSVQPYGVVLPRGFGEDPKRKWRLDVVLHGRDATLNEVKFIQQSNAGKPAPEQDFIQLDVFGRGNNGYRWAGERDVFEAIFHFTLINKQLLRVEGFDPSKIILRGFSMGGAGAWHLGLHYPHSWCAVSPGAGFTTTKGYVKDLPDPLPPYQEACLRIYDAVNYAENAFNVPIIAYGGDQDPQLAAARNVEAVLKPLNVPMTLIVGPNTGHKYEPESLKRIMGMLAERADTGKPEFPAKVRFVTFHPLYGKCYWVGILAQERQYERSFVEAERAGDVTKVKTENVAVLELELGLSRGPHTRASVEIDGQALDVATTYSAQLQQNVAVLQKSGGHWAATHGAKLKIDVSRKPRKLGSLCGPIDAAFMDPFLCVRGTGKPWNAATQRHADAALERFQREWSKYFRGELEVKDDVEVAPEDMEAHHLVLFGDPGSNHLLALARDRLPLEWSPERLTLGDQSFDAAAHVPVLIHPSPFALAKYVVVNSGHTFHAPEFQGSNALLFPRLGDYAILRPRPTDDDPCRAEVVAAGLFDEHWRVK